MQNISKDQKIVSLCIRTGICDHGSSTFIKRILIMSQTTFRDCPVLFVLFSGNLSRNSCIQRIPHKPEFFRCYCRSW